MFCLKNLFPDTHFVDFVSTGFIGGKTVSNATLSLTKGEIISKMDASVAIDDQIRHVMSTLEWAVPAVWFGDQRFAELNYEQRMRLVDYAKNGLYHPAATWEKATPFIAGLLK